MAQPLRNIEQDFIDIENHLGMTEEEMNEHTKKVLRAMREGAPRYAHEDVKRYMLSKFTDNPLPRPKPIS